jgi:hypothetical protein
MIGAFGKKLVKKRFGKNGTVCGYGASRPHFLVGAQPVIDFCLFL